MFNQDGGWRNSRKQGILTLVSAERGCKENPQLSH